MKYVWYAVMGAGIIALVYILLNFSKLGSSAAPLNASGYQYPSTPGA